MTKAHYLSSPFAVSNSIKEQQLTRLSDGTFAVFIPAFDHPPWPYPHAPGAEPIPMKCTYPPATQKYLDSVFDEFQEFSKPASRTVDFAREHESYIRQRLEFAKDVKWNLGPAGYIGLAESNDRKGWTFFWNYRMEVMRGRQHSSLYWRASLLISSNLQRQLRKGT